MDYDDMQGAASIMADYGRRMKAMFAAYFKQENGKATEARFMAYLREALTSEDFDSWEKLYEALKRDLAKDPTIVPPFPWLEIGHDREAQKEAKPVYQLRNINPDQAEIYKEKEPVPVGICIRDTSGLWYVICRMPRHEYLRSTWLEPSEALAGYLEFVVQVEDGDKRTGLIDAIIPE